MKTIIDCTALECEPVNGQIKWEPIVSVDGKVVRRGSKWNDYSSAVEDSYDMKRKYIAQKWEEKKLQSEKNPTKYIRLSEVEALLNLMYEKYKDTDHHNIISEITNCIDLMPTKEN